MVKIKKTQNEKVIVICLNCKYKIENDKNIFNGLETSYICPKCGYEGYVYDNDKIVKIGVVGVDSGQILICDPCYIDDEWKEEDFSDDKPKNNFSYNACSHITIKDLFGQLKYKMGHDGVGVVSCSGWGDGCYPVYATIENNRVKKIEIIFINDNKDQ